MPDPRCPSSTLYCDTSSASLLPTAASSKSNCKKDDAAWEGSKPAKFGFFPVAPLAALHLSSSHTVVQDRGRSVLPNVAEEAIEAEETEGPIDDRRKRVPSNVAGLQPSPEIGCGQRGDAADATPAEHIVGAESTTSSMAYMWSGWSHGDVAQTNQIGSHKPRESPAAPLHKMRTDIWTPDEAHLSRDVDDDNDVYRTLARNRRNLVLDSVCPELAPHIIITPPADTEDDYLILSQNCLAPQWQHYLMVPPSPLYLLPSNLNGCATLAAETPSGAAHDPPCPSRVVFSRSKFAKTIEQSSAERLILYHVVAALHRRQRKACAFAASIVAVSFRSRYDSPDFIWKSDKPFSWTDAAEASLLISTRHWGTVIIDSPCPLTAPHIIINEAPPPNPWVRWQNARDGPQDRRYLTVPAQSSAALVSEPDEGEESISSPAPALSDESPPESPLPGTPPYDSGASSGEFGCDCDADLHCLHDVAYAANFARPACELFAAEDEGLPPFDTWYTSVMERLQPNV